MVAQEILVLLVRVRTSTGQQKRGMVFFDHPLSSLEFSAIESVYRYGAAAIENLSVESQGISGCSNLG